MTEQPQATCPACGHAAIDHRVGCECFKDYNLCLCALRPADIALLTSPTRKVDAEIVRIVREPSDDEARSVGNASRGTTMTKYSVTQGGHAACDTILALAAKKGGSDATE